MALAELLFLPNRNGLCRLKTAWLLAWYFLYRVRHYLGSRRGRPMAGQRLIPETEKGEFLPQSQVGYTMCGSTYLTVLNCAQ